MSGETQMGIVQRRQAIRRILCVGCFLVSGPALSRSLCGQQPPAQVEVDERWIGQRVVQKVAKLTLRINDEPVEGNDDSLRFYQVEQIDGASLLLKPEGQGKEGWANAVDVIRIAEALDFFRQEIRRNPKDPFSFAMMGLLRGDRNEHDLAIRSYDEAIRLDPQNSAGYTGRARSWYAKNEYDRATADYDAAILRDPENVVAHIGRGLTWFAKDRSTQAIADFSEAIWLDPLSTSAYFNRGRAWQSKKEYAKAIIDYNMAARLDPQQAGIFRERGKAWEAQKRYRNAIADYSEAIRIDPSDPQAYRDQAGLLATCPDRALRDAKAAVMSARKACELTHWREASALDALARASAAIGDFKSAVTWQTRSNALARSPAKREEGEARLKQYLEKRPEP
jgi:tetratricopeptide (TPR) repeat protein